MGSLSSEVPYPGGPGSPVVSGGGGGGYCDPHQCTKGNLAPNFSLWSQKIYLHHRTNCKYKI